jgi:hypothetical protein
LRVLTRIDGWHGWDFPQTKVVAYKELRVVVKGRVDMLIIQELELVWPAMKFESIDENKGLVRMRFPRTKEVTAWVAFRRWVGMLVIHVSRIYMRWLS